MHDVVMVERCDQTMAECRSCDWVSGWHRGDFGRGVAETMAKNHRAVSKLDHVLTVSKMPNMSWQPGEANAIRVATCSCGDWRREWRKFVIREVVVQAHRKHVEVSDGR